MAVSLLIAAVSLPSEACAASTVQWPAHAIQYLVHGSWAWARMSATRCSYMLCHPVSNSSSWKGGHAGFSGPPVMVRSARLRFWAAVLMICSSMLLAVASRRTSTSLRCPSLWALAWACRSIWGFLHAQQHNAFLWGSAPAAGGLKMQQKHPCSGPLLSPAAGPPLGQRNNQVTDRWYCSGLGL